MPGKDRLARAAPAGESGCRLINADRRKMHRLCTRAKGREYRLRCKHVHGAEVRFGSGQEPASIDHMAIRKMRSPETRITGYRFGQLSAKGRSIPSPALQEHGRGQALGPLARAGERRCGGR